MTFRVHRVCSSAAARRGATGVPFAVWLLALSACVFVWGRTHARKERTFARIEAGRAALDVPGAWVDPHWELLLAEQLAGLGPFAPDDTATIASARALLANLPFVAEVGEPVVLWPDGLQVPVRLADPVACVAVGRHYLAVDGDGRVLPGLWNAPPPKGAGHLPVLGPLDGSTANLRPGERVPSAQLAGVSVARSMWEHLAPDDLETLGRVLVDATRADRTSVEEPGTRILLEGRRLVLFGRTPDADAPGELPVEHKWRSLSRGLTRLRRDRDWDLLDVRWDVPEVRARVLAAAELDGEPYGAAESRGLEARGGSRR